LCTGLLLNKFPGFAPTDVFLGVLSLIGFGFNVWLYFDDVRNRGSILNNVAHPVIDIVTSPAATERLTRGEAGSAPIDYKLSNDQGAVIADAEIVMMTEEQRRAVKRSIARQSFAK
jgi:hypothetical protein